MKLDQVTVDMQLILAEIVNIIREIIERVAEGYANVTEYVHRGNQNM